MKSISMTIQTDLELIKKETPTQRVLEISITAPTAAPRITRPSLNLAMVLDRSGSMSGEKIEFAKKAADHVLSMLQESDKAALVAFDDQVLSLSPSQAVTDEGRLWLRDQLSRLKPGGQTNLSGGWLQGCQLVAGASRDGVINRTLLLTDGLANVGITDMEELGFHAREIHNRGVSTSTFGIGGGFNEHLLELMANQGGGNFYYIASPNQIPEIFARELSELTSITARNLEIDIEFPPQVDAQLLGGWKHVMEANHLRIWAGDLASEQKREIYIQLLTPPFNQLPTLPITVTARGMEENGALLEGKSSLTLKYASSEEIAAAKVDPVLMSRFSEVKIASDANEALKLEREGKTQEARRTLMESLLMNQSYISE